MALFQVIKYDGPAGIIVWKHPNEEIGTWSQLIVNESQEVVLLKGGKITKVYSAGRHKLNTANIPLLKRIVNLPFGGRSPFTAELWFINKATTLDVKWGTPTPVQVQDQKYGVTVPVRTNGIMGLIIVDSRVFLSKLIGTLGSFSSDNIADHFRGIYITKIKDMIAQYVIVKKISVFELNAHLNEISEHVQKSLQTFAGEYGIDIVHFSINDLSFPDDDPSVKRIRESLAKKADMDIVGYTYQQKRTFDVLEGAAKNKGVPSDFMGAGLGFGAGQAFGKEINNMFESMNQKDKDDENYICRKCSAKLDKEMKFCNQCGAQVNICCPYCSATLQRGDKFCSKCGEKI